MISFLEKLPDSMMGIVIAGTLWFGFHYVVLAERAMDKRIASEVVPACERVLDGAQGRADAALSPLDAMRTMPLFGESFAMLRDQFRVSAIERRRICECSARRTARASRFDFAIHTASLRLIEPSSVSDLRGEAMQVLRSQVCGELPWMKG